MSTKRKNMSQLESSRKLRKVCFTEAARLAEDIEMNGERWSKIQISIQLNLLERYFVKFDEYQGRIEEVEEQVGTTDRAKFERIYANLKEKLINLESRFNVSEPQPGTSSSTHSFDIAFDNNQRNSVRFKSMLPAVNLPKFDGTFSKWTDFRNMFTNLIDNNQDLPNIEKFQMLKTCLSGAAAQVVNSLECTDQNYKEALDLLRKRFENKRLIFSSHFNQIVNLSSIRKRNSLQLRQLLDQFKVEMRALNGIANANQINDAFLIQHLYNKLDNETRSKWNNHFSSNEIPQLSDFIEFMEKDCQRLECMENSNPNNSHRIDSSDRKNIKIQRSVHVTNIQDTCTFCKQGNHSTHKCVRFLNLSVKDRVEFAKRSHLCLNCLKVGHFSRNCKSTSCFKCSKRHHTTLHFNSEDYSSNSSTKATTSESLEEKKSKESNCLTSSNNDETIIATAIVDVSSNSNLKLPCRVLLDSASQSNFITENLAQQLGLKRHTCNTTIVGFASKQTAIKHKVYVTVFSKNTKFKFDVEALIIPKITSTQPSTFIKTSDWHIPGNICLADPNFNVPSKIDILVGADYFMKLLCVGQISLGSHLPTLQKTLLGWVVSGRISIPNLNEYRTKSTLHTTTELDHNIDNIIRKFWEIENLPHKIIPQSIEEKRCEDHFVHTVQRAKDGRFIVKLPFKSLSNKLGNSYNSALQRFKHIERKMAKNHDFKTNYKNFMQEYESLGHMQHTDSIDPDHYYLPHHGVIQQSNSEAKLRVVFNASCKTSSGICLNDLLMIGPKILNDLFSVLCRFRCHRFVLSADISKMYRQILVQPSDTNFQLIIWRSDPCEELKTYKLKTVTYGTACAPFLAIRCVKQLALENKEQFPFGALALETDLYVDDILTGADTPSELQTIRNELESILEKGCMKLHKWSSNCTDIISHINPNICQKTVTLYNNETVKTLGINWQPQDDKFVFNFSVQTSKITKRNVLSVIASFFDPLGFINPIIVIVKIFMQKLWKAKIGWDESLPIELYTEWVEFTKQIPHINDIIIPRNVFASHYIKTEIHGFADASQLAYGACIYLLSVDVNNTTETNLLCSKSRVPTQDNPADIVSRGLVPSKLRNNELWFKGPQFLQFPEQEWPSLKYIETPTNERKNEKSTLISRIRTDIVSGVKYANSYLVTRRIFAYVTIFIQKCKNRSSKSSNTTKSVPYILTVQDLNNGEKTIIKLIQNFHYFKEITRLKLAQPLSKDSHLISLNIFLDSEGIIRVGGRLENSELPYDSKHQMILPREHVFTKSLVFYTHLNNMHVGALTLNAILRQKYWIPSSRALIRSIIHNCIHCFRQRPTITKQLMGNLPKNRVTPSYPFLNTGVDYCGPFLIKQFGRGKHPVKVYIALFICLSTKAVHLETVFDLSTEAFIAALKRFIARRGKCRTITSDNATNFLGAKRELEELRNLLLSQLHNNIVRSFCSDEGISWTFIPPRSPHFGGLWEAGVKKAKFHLSHLLKTNILHLEEFITVVAQIEGILNSRPLTPLSSDPTDLEALTPSHFLLGRTIQTIAEPEITHLKENKLSRWQQICRLQQCFWKRWSIEYLNTLQQRPKWKQSHQNIKIGTMVLIKDQQLIPASWPLGRVVKIIHGDDNRVRVVDVQTQKGVFRRSIHNLSVLPIIDNN